MYNNGKEVNYAYALINGTYRGLETMHHTGSMRATEQYIYDFLTNSSLSLF
ncbi:hypothetical protein OKW21_003376 [Catalinimonas alkaloidigena]|uniref:hypothetical protein n=1 Tax=Catalinimonas alkaloidigena TaxID=1075417 RepID=UPI002406B1E5|nr:hypothetical protein [Catalinimonas alkaloidigena]MDF9798113.1 hypothetical protein [Catalinimonas alkaloidigena]